MNLNVKKTYFSLSILYSMEIYNTKFYLKSEILLRNKKNKKLWI